MRISASVSHVAPPDPANFWPFTEGHVRTLCAQPVVAFRADRIHDGLVAATLILGEEEARGVILLDQPMVLVRDGRTNEPAITVTLRRVEDGTAYLQVSGYPDLKEARRQ